MTIYQTGCFDRSFGTFPLRDDDLRSAVATAAEIGYRAFDTAQWYGNEADLGAALADLGIDRDNLLVTTKVHPENATSDRFMVSVEQSLKDLRLDQVDVLLIHWPPKDNPVELQLSLLQEARHKGYAKHIGVSNYTVKQMQDAVAHLDVPLVTNQVEFHPLLDQTPLLAASSEMGIPLASYCSVARGKVFDYPLFAEIGARYGKSAAQVVLRWILQQGVSINTMSTKRANIAANFDVVDFELTQSEMAQIQALTSTNYRISNARAVPHTPTWDTPEP